ncbi:MAG: hypothetical protein ACI8Z1_002631 [Candidatus Azotimanducaceae bacterium]|jgi:hypothetical protein
MGPCTWVREYQVATRIMDQHFDDVEIIRGVELLGFLKRIFVKGILVPKKPERVWWNRYQQ